MEEVFISLPCFLSEQISELLCIGDVLRTEHFGQVKDSRASGWVFRLFLEIRLVEFINKEIPLWIFSQVIAISFRIVDSPCDQLFPLIGQRALLHRILDVVQLRCIRDDYRHDLADRTNTLVLVQAKVIMWPEPSMDAIVIHALLQLKCGQESSHFSQERNGRNGSHLEYWFWMYFATTSLLMLPSVLI